MVGGADRAERRLGLPALVLGVLAARGEPAPGRGVDEVGRSAGHREKIAGGHLGDAQRNRLLVLVEIVDELSDLLVQSWIRGLAERANFAIVGRIGGVRRRGFILRAVGAYGLPNCLRMTIGSEEANRGVIEALRAFMAGGT